MSEESEGKEEEEDEEGTEDERIEDKEGTAAQAAPPTPQKETTPDWITMLKYAATNDNTIKGEYLKLRDVHFLRHAEDFASLSFLQTDTHIKTLEIVGDKGAIHEVLLGSLDDSRYLQHVSLCRMCTAAPITQQGRQGAAEAGQSRAGTGELAGDRKFVLAPFVTTTPIHSPGTAAERIHTR